MTPFSTSATAPGRRRGRVLSLIVTALAVGVGAWFALRRRAPALPTSAQEAAPAGGVRPGTATDGASDTSASDTSGSDTSGSDTSASDASGSDPAAADASATDAVAHTADADTPGAEASETDRASEELQRVSGVGRRSADALVAAGIDSLDRLADSDDATLVAALEAADVPRAVTLSSWASQARRLDPS